MTEEEKKTVEYLNLVAKERTLIPLCDDITTVLNLIQKQDTQINKLNNVIQNIREEFLKYDWENSTKEQICNQLKSLYESIFMKEETDE